MSNKWKYDKLSNLCLRIGDGLHGTPQYSDDTGYFFINGNNLRNGKIEISQDTKTVNEVEYKNNYIALDGRSLLLGINGSIGNMAFYNNEKVMLGKSSAYLNFKTGINKFFYYYFQLKSIQKYFYDVATGSTIKNLSLQSLQDFIVPVPEENEWKKIAYALSAIDSKIELNSRINAELDRMIKTLYNYWFVQFDFPDQNGKPYKTSGGKMIWCEDLKRDIPGGWEMKKLTSIFIFKKGIEPGASEYVDSMETADYIKFYRVGDIDGSSVTYIDSKGKKYERAEERDVIVTFDGSVGKVGFGLDGAYSGGLRKIFDETGKLNNALVYSIFKDERIIAIIHKYATGSILLHASSSIDNLTIPFYENIYLKFQNIIIPMFDKMVKNKSENQKLTEIRDWLLPMLMNRQVKVKQ